MLARSWSAEKSCAGKQMLGITHITAAFLSLSLSLSVSLSLTHTLCLSLSLSIEVKTLLATAVRNLSLTLAPLSSLRAQLSIRRYAVTHRTPIKSHYGFPSLIDKPDWLFTVLYSPQRRRRRKEIESERERERERDR